MAKRTPATGFDSVFNRTQSTISAKPSRSPQRQKPEQSAPIKPLPAPPAAPASDQFTPGTMGRPRKHIETMAKVTTQLPASLVGFLDGLSATIKGNTGQTVSRTDFLTALIGALRESGLDLTGLSSESDIRAFLLERLNR
jgi:hypothetical protein